MNRFYDSVEIRAEGASWQVTLDGRGLKTVKGAPQLVPTQALARMLADEWDIEGEQLDPAKFVARDMADYAIDVIGADRAALADKLLSYGETDTLLYRADPDEPLFARQQEVWEPVLTAIEAREGVELVRVSGVIHKPQRGTALATLRSRIEAQSRFALAGMEAMTSLSASLVIALSATATAHESEALKLWQAAHLEEEWQAELWGRDFEDEQRRAKRLADFLKAWRFVRAAQA